MVSHAGAVGGVAVVVVVDSIGVVGEKVEVGEVARWEAFEWW